MPAQHHHQQDLNKALNIGLLALAGAIIPVVGVILAIVAERLARSVPTTDKTAGKKGTVQTLAVLAFLLSVGCGILYYAYYSNQAKKAAEQAQQEQNAKTQAENDAKFEASAKEYKYQACITHADEAYNQYLEINTQRTTTNAAGEKIYYLSQPQWDYVEQKRANEKTACLNEKL
jgi:uncharacterized protein HemX